MSDGKKIFSYDEAVALMPEVRALTEKAVVELEGVLGDDVDWSATDAIEVPSEHLIDYERVVSGWASSIADLGVEVKGLWLIDFDSGAGYYCWRWPENALKFFHEYEEGFGGRVELN